MAIKQPTVMPYWLDKQLSDDANSTYQEFSKAAHSLQDKQSIANLASGYVSDINSKFRQAVFANKATEQSLDYMNKTLFPAALESISSIAKSGKFKEINTANTYLSYAYKDQANYIKYQKDKTNIMASMYDIFISSVCCMQNIIDAESAIDSDRSNSNSAGYWSRCTYLYQFDIDHDVGNVITLNQLVQDQIALASANIGKIFDIDDALNGSNSYRSTHKVLTAQAEVEERDRQAQIDKVDAFSKVFCQKAMESKLGPLLIQAYLTILAGGNKFIECPKDRPSIADRAPSASTPADEVNKQYGDLLVWDVCNGVYNDLANVTASKIWLINLFNGGKFTKDAVSAIVKGATTVVKPAAIGPIMARLKSNYTSALSQTTPAATGGKTQIEMQAEADKKAKEALEAKYAEEKAANDAQYEQTKQDLIIATAKLKAADERAQQEKDLAEKLKDVKIGDNDFPIAPIAPIVAASPEPSFLDREIFGIPAPYAIGGAVAALGLVIIVARK